MSNVKELLFHNPVFGHDTLDDITSHITALERFSYSVNGAHILPGDMPTKPKWTIEILVKNAGHPLQHLVLGCDPLEFDRIRPSNICSIPANKV
jgi:hypothetical protein